jgi:hypothetical protein
VLLRTQANLAEHGIFAPGVRSAVTLDRWRSLAGALENRYRWARTVAPLKAGYGLFLGYAALQGLVLAYSRLTGSVDFWPILVAIALLALAGGLTWTRSRTLAHDAASQEHSHKL